MRLVPKRQQDKLAWCRTRVGPWTANAQAIGTTDDMVAAFADEVEAARVALARAAAARDEARNAALAARIAVARMDKRAAGIVLQVRVRAETTHDPNVYALASIPAPATPSPVAPPGAPTGFTVELLGDGSFTIAWKCRHPAGSKHVLYEVWRRAVSGGSGGGGSGGAIGERVYLATVGERKFHGTSPVAGAAMFIYEIRAVRSTGPGPWATFNVSFGAPAPGSKQPRGAFIPAKRRAARSAA